MSRYTASDSEAHFRRHDGGDAGPSTVMAPALLLIASVTIAAVAVAIPYAFVGSALLIGAMLVASFTKQSIGQGLFWVMVISLVILVVGTGLGMVNTLFLTPVETAGA